MTRVGQTSTNATAVGSEENDDHHPRLPSPTVRRSHTKVIERDNKRQASKRITHERRGAHVSSTVHGRARRRRSLLKFRAVVQRRQSPTPTRECIVGFASTRRLQGSCNNGKQKLSENQKTRAPTSPQQSGTDAGNVSRCIKIEPSCNDIGLQHQHRSASSDS